MIPRALMYNVVVAGISAAALAIAAQGAIAETASSGRAPAILVPDCLLTGSQRSDAPVDVRFVTASDASVDLSSLRVWVHQFNGWLDVTDMLLRHPQVRVGGWGIHFEGGVLPAGEHQVRVSFHDLKGRTADETRTIRIAQVAG